MKKVALVLVLGSLAFAQEDTPDKRLRQTTETFKEMTSMPDKGVPESLLDKAECVVIVPGMKKAAFVVGGEYGRGFAACRKGSGWSGPAAVRLAGGSVGFQLGGDSTDLILLVMNNRGLQHMLSDKFTIGADAEAAAGPVGRNASADTDILMHAEILSWSRTRGVFAGISLKGTVVEADRSEDQKLYGRAVSNREIINGSVTAPAGGHDLITALNRYNRHENNADRQRN